MTGKCRDSFISSAFHFYFLSSSWVYLSSLYLSYPCIYFAAVSLLFSPVFFSLYFFLLSHYNYLFIHISRSLSLSLFSHTLRYFLFSQVVTDIKGSNQQAQFLGNKVESAITKAIENNKVPNAALPHRNSYRTAPWHAMTIFNRT